MRAALRRLLECWLAAGMVGCALEGDFEYHRQRRPRAADAALADAGTAAASGDAGPAASALPAFSVVTWNLEWFQHPENGPSDEPRQFQGALTALSHIDADVLALQEISDRARFADLLAALPGYAAVITEFDWPQQLALLYRTAEFELTATAAIEGLADAGRPPLRAELRARSNGARLVVVVVHAKAGGRESDWQTRERLAVGLHEQLAATHTEDAALIVLGDLNDRLSTSTVAGRPSPYAGFVDDPSYAAPTAALETGPETSTAWGQTVDHILVGEELTPQLRDDSANVLRDELLSQNPDLLAAVSDHVPVLLRLFSPARRTPD